MLDKPRTKTASQTLWRPCPASEPAPVKRWGCSCRSRSPYLCGMRPNSYITPYHIPDNRQLSAGTTHSTRTLPLLPIALHPYHSTPLYQTCGTLLALLACPSPPTTGVE